MKQLTSVFLAVALCFSLCLSAFAANKTELIWLIDPPSDEQQQPTPEPTPANSADTGASNGNDTEEVSDSGEVRPASSSTANPTTPSSSSQSQQQTPTATPTTTGGSSSGGYASPIVNIEAIEVPLADGTTIVLPFLDVPQDAYYTEAVAWAYSHDPQITGGVADDRFDPLATCTRGQMVTFLWRAAGSPEPKGDASKFTDVKAGEYYAKAVAWAVENNITLGMSETTFEPSGPVSRAQAVTFLWRAQGKPSATAGDTYADVVAGSYYEQAVQWAAAKNVTKGTGNGFEPSTTVNRAMSVTFLYRTYVGA